MTNISVDETGNKQQHSLHMYTSSELSLFMARLVTLLRELFLADMNANEQLSFKQQQEQRQPLYINEQETVIYKRFELNNFYSNSDYEFWLTHTSGQKPNAISLILNLFRVSFYKCNHIHSSLPVAASVATAAASAAVPINVPVLNPTTKNMLRPLVSIEEQAKKSTQTSNEAENKNEISKENNRAEEDDDDYLFIGSWFDEQSTSSNLDVTAKQTDVEEKKSSVEAMPATNECNNQSIGVNLNSSDATQILDTTFELETSNEQNSFENVRYSVYLFISYFNLLFY
jgi:hypothetical protein